MTRMQQIFTDFYSVRNGSLGSKCHAATRPHPVKDASLTGCEVSSGVIAMLPSDASLTGCKRNVAAFPFWKKNATFWVKGSHLLEKSTLPFWEKEATFWSKVRYLFDKSTLPVENDRYS